jgi:glyoxylase-like metal-dependent hydrolase (beta-lactamase superfamily II)
MQLLRSCVTAAILSASVFAAMLPGNAWARSRPRHEPLALDVYTADDRAFYVTATFIHGKKEGVLIDTQFHENGIKALVELVSATHLKLKAIFVTHPDGDHYSGMAAFRSRYPGVPIYMTARAVQEFKRTVDASQHLPIPEALPADGMSVDGQEIKFITDLQGDYAAAPANTAVWIPSLRTLITDDLVFRGVHPWLTDSTPDTRAAWLAALKRIAALDPAKLIPGHQFGHELNLPAQDLDFMARYIAAFDAVARTAPDAPAFIAEMKSRFPDLAGPRLLEVGATSLYPKKPT